ncbi:T9SS type A sorting domain-containing protein [Labilibacter sediminis]|nr:T9SS type A sorting domain-containing protein [Labilibacter sediminis]
MKSLFVTSVITFTYLFSWAQVPIGGWQDYFSYSEVHSVEKVNNKIYAATNVGLFFYDSDEFILKTVTKINGLSDIGISAIGTIPNSNKLFIGYENGNIDILNDNNVDNIPDLKMKPMNNSKRINHISFINNKAFCSTDFGILVVDIIKNEISDFYYIGDNATNLVIHQVCEANDSVYAASEQGVLGAPADSPLLSYFETWKLISPNKNIYSTISTVDDKLIASTPVGNNHDIYSYSSGAWTKFTSQSNFKDINSIGDKFALITKNEISIYNDQFEKIESISKYDIEDKKQTPNFSSILIDEQNQKWIGDASNGLVQIRDTDDKQILPDGPNSNQCHKLVATANSLWVVPGPFHEIVPKYNPAECSILRNGYWTKLNSSNTPLFRDAFNINDIAIDPNNDKLGYLASARNGIFEVENDRVTYNYNPTNSTVQPVFNNPNSSMRLINGVITDPYGNLFANNQEVTHPVVVKPFGVKDDASKWFKYDYMKNDDPNKQTWLHQMLYTPWGHIWSIAVVDPYGLFIFDTNNTIETDADDVYRGVRHDILDDRFSIFHLWNEEGDIITDNPTALSIDKNEYIWVGTTNGILVYYRPREVMNIDKPIASRIKVPRNDGSELADYLLENESITSIAIDGANRKWIGTVNSGVFLVSADGTKTLHTFNTANSVLISNNIRSISINPNSGEVFIGTDKGIVSYQGTATEGNINFTTPTSFPNPVNPGYSGVITITGLVENSSIKITDLSGKVVYEAMSTGGQVIWNGKNMYNEKVGSGVYLVFATNKDGSESMATKIMIIR